MDIKGKLLGILHTGRHSHGVGIEAFILSLSRIITLGVDMGIVMMLSRFRTFQEYGTYSQLTLTINLFVSIFMLGLPNSVNYFLARAATQEERRNFLSLYFTLGGALGILTGAVLTVSIPLICAYFGNPSISDFYYYLAIYPWVSITSSSIGNILIVYGRTRFLMAYNVIRSISTLALVFGIEQLGFGFTAYIKGLLIINIVFALSVYVITQRLCGKLRPHFDKELTRRVFAISLPLGLGGIVGTLDVELDKLLIGYLMTTEQMAIYTNAAKELPFRFIASSITAVLLPRMTRMMRDGKGREAIQLWSHAIVLAFIPFALIVAGVFTYAEAVMTILYSEKYLPGVMIYRVYTLNLLLQCTMFGSALLACGQTKKIFYCNLLSLLANMILNPLFYWMFGVTGPAIATLLANLIVQLLQLLLTAKHLRISFSEVFPWARCGRISLISLVFAAVFWAVKAALPLERMTGDVAESVILGLCWAMIYLFFMKKEIRTAWNNLNHAES